MSESIEKRTIEELIARYELEPTLKDIYVEGNIDKNLIEWFLRGSNFSDITVYEITTIEVPSELIQELSDRGHIFLEYNNRGRIITLAYALDERVSVDLTHNVACIADTDFNYLLDRNYSCRLLLFTDYAAMEMYLFDEQIVNKFLSLFIGSFPHDASYILPAFEPILQDLFFLRAAKQELQLGVQQLDFGRCCTVSGTNVQFDFDDYVNRFLTRGNIMSRRSEVLAKIDSYRAKGLADVKQLMHGHDFVELLYWYVDKIKRPSKDYDKRSFPFGLFTCLEFHKLIDKPLFIELISRFT